MRPPKFSFLLLTLSTALLASACKPQQQPLSRELTTPMLAVELGIPAEGGQERLFFSPAAVASLPGTSEELAKRAEAYSAYFHDPKGWRSLYRQERFETVLLTGDPALFRPLLDHLRVSRDWTLTYVDATSIVFQRSGTEWQTEALAPLLERLKSHPRQEQLLFRVQVINRLIALQKLEAAKTLLDETLKIDDRYPPALAELASWHAMQAQWEPALEAAQRAVRADKNYLPGVAAEANALFAHGRFSEALRLTRRLTKEQPDDGASLYLHAKVTHAARAFAEEIVALEKIIAMAEERKMPTSTWRVYLGQAYGATGEGERSIAEFELALKDPDLSEAERKFATRAIERIKGREPIL